ncbi:hypothetical protein [Actinomadura macra]|uniref:hypothetical protein n=1 Tax=Actinomadura macra TaxID=46164 RepID=UPI0008338A7F|nr:hypothetical protein [Actinomadura macra]
MAEQPTAEIRSGFALPLTQKQSSFCTTVWSLVREDLRRQRLLQLLVRAVERGLRVLDRQVENGRQIGDRQLVADPQLQDLPRQQRERQDGLPCHDALVNVFLIMTCDRNIGRSAPGGQPARTLQPRDGVQPWPEPIRLPKPINVRLRDHERVAQRDLGRVTIAQLEPAVGVEPVGIRVVHRGQGVRITRA